MKKWLRNFSRNYASIRLAIAAHFGLIPFDRHFTPEEQDNSLKKLFRKHDNMNRLFPIMFYEKNRILAESI